MNTIEYLMESGDVFGPPIVAGLAVACMSAALSVFVVLKRLAFVGQGVSHAAFGGVGLVAVMGWAGTAWLFYGVVGAFCVLAALAISAISDRSADRADTAVGIVLVGSMALGAVLLGAAQNLRPGERVPSWESVLFGSIVNVGWIEAWVAVAVACGVLAALWWMRRGMLYWALDATAAEASGVSSAAMRRALLVLVALAIIVAMRLVGVVLASAMLILPGAIALRLATRWRAVHAAALLVSVGSVLVGFVLSFELDRLKLATGPAIVAVLVGCYGCVRLMGAMGSTNRRAGSA